MSNDHISGTEHPVQFIGLFVLCKETTTNAK